MYKKSLLMKPIKFIAFVNCFAFHLWSGNMFEKAELPSDR